MNSKIISCGENGDLFIWEKKEEKYDLIKKANNLKNTIYNLLQIKENNFISCDDIGNLICWNFKNLNQVFEMKVVKSKWNNGIVKIDDSKILIGGKKKIQLINLKEKKIEKSIHIYSNIFSIELLKDNYFIYGDNYGNIEIRDINSFKLITKKTFLNNEIIYDIKKMNDNYFLFCSDQKRIFLIKYLKS